jgi:hypothetical protein
VSGEEFTVLGERHRRPVLSHRRGGPASGPRIPAPANGATSLSKSITDSGPGPPSKYSGTPASGSRNWPNSAITTLSSTRFRPLANWSRCRTSSRRRRTRNVRWPSLLSADSHFSAGARSRPWCLRQRDLSGASSARGETMVGASRECPAQRHDSQQIAAAAAAILAARTCGQRPVHRRRARPPGRRGTVRATAPALSHSSW